MKSITRMGSGWLGIALSLSLTVTQAKVIELAGIESVKGGFLVNGATSQNSADFDFEVTGIGDVNNDNKGDFLVAMPTASPEGLTTQGMVYVVYGKDDGDPIDLSAVQAGQGGYALVGLSAQSQLGYAVSAAGDVNADTIDDFIIHALNAPPDSGRDNVGVSYVIFGRNDPNGENTVGFSLTNLGQANPLAGFAIYGLPQGSVETVVSNAGDMNRDGFVDVLIGKPTATVMDARGNELAAAGVVYVVLGKGDLQPVELTDIAEGNGGFVINGFQANARFGAAMSPAENINGDGFPDMIIGAPGADVGGANAGQAFVIYGFSTLTLSQPFAALDTGAMSRAEGGGFVINGSPGDELGFAVSLAGDVNADTLSDVIVGAPKVDVGNNVDAGAAYVVFGRRNNDSPVDANRLGQAQNPLGFSILGANSGDETGYAVTAAGDFNQDTLSDVLVAAPGAAPLALPEVTSPDTTTPPDTGTETPPQQTTGDDTSIPPPDSDTEQPQQQGTGDDLLPLPPAPQSSTRAGERDRAGVVYLVKGKADITDLRLNNEQIDSSMFDLIYGVSANHRTGDSLSFTSSMDNDELPEILISALQGEVSPDQPNAAQIFVVYNRTLKESVSVPEPAADTDFILPPIPDQTITLGNTLAFTIPIENPDSDIQLKIRGLPKEEAHISPEGGRFSWKPRTDGIYRVTIVAELVEPGPPETIAEEKFTITVVESTTTLSAEEVLLLDDSRMGELDPTELSGFDKEKVEKIPDSGFSVMQADQVAALTHEGLEGMRPEQFQQLPKESLSGLNANNIGGLSPDVIREMTTTDLQALTAEEIKQAPPPDLAKFLTNLEMEQIDFESIKALLPNDWSIDETTGQLRVPKGTKLQFRALQPPPKERFAVPELPDMSKGLGVSGQASRSILDGINEVLRTAEGFSEEAYYELVQLEEGIVEAQGRGAFTGVNLALIPDTESFEQTEEIDGTLEEPAVQYEVETGRYIVITPDNQKFAFRAAPKRAADLVDALGENATIEVGENGELIIGITTTDAATRSNTTVYTTYTVDAFVETAPAETGVYDNQDGSYTIVYDDGTAQTATLSVPYPSVFISEAYKIEGVEEVIYTSTGAFTVTYVGSTLILTAISQVTGSVTGTEPYITIETDSTIAYGVQESSSAIVSILEIGF